MLQGVGGSGPHRLSWKGTSGAILVEEGGRPTVPASYTRQPGEWYHNWSSEARLPFHLPKGQRWKAT